MVQNCEFCFRILALSSHSERPSVRPWTSVTSHLISTIWPFGPHKPNIFCKLMTPTIQRPTYHSPITFPDPADSLDPPKTWPFIFLSYILHFDVYRGGRFLLFLLNEYFYELNPRKNPVLNIVFELNPRKKNSFEYFFLIESKKKNSFEYFFWIEFVQKYENE